MFLGNLVALAKIFKPREPCSADVDDGSFDNVENVWKTIVCVVIMNSVREPTSQNRRILITFFDVVLILCC